MPILLIVAIFAFLRLRRPSLLLVMFGASLYVASSVLLALEPSQHEFPFNPALVTQYLGLLVGVGGLVWFWQKDRRAISTQSSPVLDRNGR